MELDKPYYAVKLCFNINSHQDISVGAEDVL